MSPVFAAESAFSLSSPDVAQDARVPAPFVYGDAGGQNLSPALSWSAVPVGTQSFAVTVFDPDAPRPQGWWHWLVYNLPADLNGLPQGAGRAEGSALPEGAVQGVNDYGEVGYGGPCPPVGHGPHRYIFTVYALKVPHLDLPAGASAALIEAQLHAHALAQSTLTAVYKR